MASGKQQRRYENAPGNARILAGKRLIYLT